MKGKCIMLQGTGSSVGKSLLVTALCRILKEDGYGVAPFKSQNMALNSYITAEGDEMGRAQVAQAEACGLSPTVEMNPILLKPTTDKKAQVIVKGKVYRNMSATEYHAFKPELSSLVREVYESLARNHDIIVLEGAGSPAEINLRENDLVNMGMAEIADAPVILVGDIDRGGVFASLAGTMLLLREEERERVKGVIINKFRGDIEILKPGLKMLEDIIKVPVLGVIPYLDIHLDDEDSVSEEFFRDSQGGDICIEIVKVPHISNFTDFKVLRLFPDISLRYVNPGEKLHNPDIVILPGTKNTIEDLQYLRESGLAQQILTLHGQGKMIIGICGGYQMLGKALSDPYFTESQVGQLEGLGLLDISTLFIKEKTTTQVKARVTENSPCPLLAGQGVEGYEIHMGISTPGPQAVPFITIDERFGKGQKQLDGVINGSGTVFGTYIHGIFDNTTFTRKLFNIVREKKGLPPLEEVPLSYREFKEKEYDRLARHVRDNLNVEGIYRLLAGETVRQGVG